MPQELFVDSRIYGQKASKRRNIRSITNEDFLILELGDYDYRGITANNWPHLRVITGSFVPITAGLPWTLR